MSADHPTEPVAADKPSKPDKPYPDYPLTAHAAGYWCKKIRGRIYYFGTWADPDRALKEYQALLAGESLEKPDRRKRARPGRPAKPHPGFPLTAHPSGYWCKKIRGKIHYFGPWADPDGALAKYLEQKDALHAGRKPRSDPKALTVKEAINAFLHAKQALVDAGELSPRTWAEYKAMSAELAAHAGRERLVADLGPDDFGGLRNKLAKKWGPHRLKKAIQYIRSIFKHAFESDLIDRPIRFGPEFKRPSMKTLRLHRVEQGAKLFTAAEVRQLLEAAGTPLKAMLLLALNCGFGNSDCGNLPRTAVDLEAGWINYPRPKTGIPRRCPLWPETIAALREALDKRPDPKREEHAGLMFVTKYGGSWAKDEDPAVISKELRKVLIALGLKDHRSFYCLRHTFRTVADEAKDQPAADHIMGHESPHMSSVYRETISDARLTAVTEHVRQWLFEVGGTAASGLAQVG